MDESRQPTVVVVDDDDVKRYTVAHVLRKAGFGVVEAATGAEGLRAAEQDPDLVILDVKLPDIDGFEVCRRIKSDPRTASIIVLHISAVMTQAEDRVRGLEEGADGYIVEPIDAPELVATVRSMLRVRVAERRARALAGQWQATFDAISDGVCLIDRHGRIVRCNGAMSGLAGVPVEAVVGQSCHELEGELFGHAADLCTHVHKSGRREVGLFEHGGRWIRATADPSHDEKGAVSGVVFIARDVTEEKRREEERADLLAREQAARSAAETASRAKDEFLATISHELRTPLNAIVGWLSLLRGGTLDEEMRERALETIERNAKAQAQLIADILDVSVIIRGQTRLRMRVVKLGPVVEAAVESIRPAAEAKQIRLESSIDSAAGPVSGDAGRLQQVVWNLLANAIKFTPRGGRVAVRLVAEGANVEIAVADTGIGIKPDFLPYVFDRFRQADSSPTRTHAGLGLGLAIVRHLVELHGGNVQAESEGTGRGATFRVHLPVAPAGPDSGGAHEAIGGGHVVLDGVRVLVVEDEEDGRAMLEAVLGHRNAEVRACASAAEALETLREWRPDVIVSDIAMPGEDGLTMLRKIRATEGDGERIPAVALTAYARQEDQRLVLEAGFQEYLTKPADPAEVLAAVARLAGRAP